MRKINTTVDVRVKVRLKDGVSLEDFLMELDFEFSDGTGSADVQNQGFTGEAVDPVTNDDGTISMTLHVEILLFADEGIDLYQIMNELDYSFEVDEDMGAFIETKILEYAVVDSR